MNFDLIQSKEILSRTPDVLEAKLSGLPSFWTDHNEGEGKWSATDIVAHLVHGEIEDWIPRCKIILFEKDKHFIPFDPQGLEKARHNKTLEQLLKEFRKLRERSLEELDQFNLSESDLNKTGIHPKFGVVTLRQHLSTWTIHDLNHLYQINRVMGKKYQEDIGPWVEFIRIARD